MTISPVSGPTLQHAAHARGAEKPVRLGNTLGKAFDFSETLKALDTDGDGTISEQEFAFYRARKQARGEYVPAAGPAPRAASASEQVARSTVDELLKRV